MTVNSSAYPYDTVVEITSTDGPYDVQGSGVLIAPNLVLTAAHVIWNSDYGTASDIVVTPAADGTTAPFGSSTVTSVSLNQIDDSGYVESKATSQSDFALLELSTPFTGIGDMSLDANYAGGTVDVTGYPASSDGVQVTDQQTVTKEADYNLLDGTSIGDGSSGGPVWFVNSSGVPEVAGLVSASDGSEGIFVQLTTADLTEISQWEAADAAALQAANPPAATTPAAATPVATPVSDQPLGSGTLFTQVDTSQSNATTAITADSYDGPLSFLAHGDAFSYNGADNVQLSAVNAVNPLIASGSGDDLLTGSATGSSILDAGTGANIENDGGNGNTTFVQNGYVAGNTWDFLQNVHGSDEDIMFGYIAGFSKISVQANGGLASDTGATVTIDPGNGNTEKVTFVGVSAANLHGCSANIDGVPSWVLWTS
jgi:V8-like Glu-specific endopeptidase